MLKIIENVRQGEQIVQKVLSTVGVARNQGELESFEKIAKSKIP